MGCRQYDEGCLLLMLLGVVVMGWLSLSLMSGAGHCVVVVVTGSGCCLHTP